MTSEIERYAILAWTQLWQVTVVALGVGLIVRLCGRDREEKGLGTGTIEGTSA